MSTFPVCGPTFPPRFRKRKYSAKVTTSFFFSHVLVSSSAHFGPLRNHRGDAALCSSAGKTLNVGKQDVCFRLSYLLFKYWNFIPFDNIISLFFFFPCWREAALSSPPPPASLFPHLTSSALSYRCCLQMHHFRFSLLFFYFFFFLAALRNQLFCIYFINFSLYFPPFF